MKVILCFYDKFKVLSCARKYNRVNSFLCWKEWQPLHGNDWIILFSWVKTILCATFVNQAIIIFSGSWEISFSQLWKKAGIEFYHHIFLIVQHLQLTIFLQAIPKAWPPTPWYLHFFSLTYLACTAHRCSSWIAGPGHHSLCPHSWVRVLYTLSCANGCIQSHRLTICSMMSTCRPLPWGKPGQNKPLLNKG